MTINVAGGGGVGVALTGLSSPDGSVAVGGSLASPTLEAGSSAFLNQYSISGLTTQWTGSAPSNSTLVTTTAPHDFQVGHGIAIYNADNTVPAGGLTPAAPTLSTVGTAGATTYTYSVALVFNAAGSLEYCTPAGPTATVSGNATLSSGNYNKVQFAPTTPGAYGIYGRVGGSLALLGLAWHLAPANFAGANTTTTPPYLGGNLAVTTTYTYQVTGVHYNGDETSSLASAVVTTGAAVHPIDLSWTASITPYQFYNLYRNGFFIAQVPVTDLQWEDNGTLAPTAQAIPTLDSFRDIGLAFPTAPVGVPPHVPTLPPVAATRRAWHTTVTAVTANTITLAVAVGGAGAPSGSLILHDDTPTIQTALTAEGKITLPIGYYNVTSLTVPAGGALNGEEAGWADLVTVTASTNPLPPSKMTTLCFTSLANFGVILGGSGTAVRNIQMFWPYQTNSVAAPNQWMPIVPYPPGIFTGQVTSIIENIVDCNSYVGIWVNGGGAKVERVEMALIRWGIYCTGAEPSIRHVRGDAAVVYSSNTDSPRLPDSTAIRGTGNLPIIEHVGVDRAIEIWWTNLLEGVTISNVWNDDVSPDALIIDTPVSPAYQINGYQFQHRLSNLYFTAGGGGLNLKSAPNGIGNATQPATAGSVTVTNGYINGNINVQGSMDLAVSNVHVGGVISGNAPSPYASPQVVQVDATNMIWGNNTNRFVVDGGTALKARVGQSAAQSSHTYTDAVISGTMYVLDNDAKETTRLRIPTGTALTAATPFSAGDIILPQHFSRATNFYVIRATANGTTATDTWQINGTTFLTTSRLAGGINRGRAGEGNGFIVTAAYSSAVASGSGVVALAVTLTPTSTVTLASPMDIEIVWCQTPLT